MKKVLFMIMVPFLGISQTTPVNISYDITAEQPATSTSYDLNLDGVNDVLLNSWFLQADNNRVVEFTFLNTDNYFKVNSFGDLRISDCSNEITHESISAYAFNSNPGYTNYSNLTINCPFVLYGYNGVLTVVYSGESITVVGFYLGAKETDPCQSLGLPELVKPASNPRYYNLLGQEVFEKKGIVIEVSENGTTRKFFE